MSKIITFQELIFTMQKFWSNQGCAILQPIDTEVGAGTLNRHTFLRVLGPEPWSAAYVQPSRRPTDGRYGKNPNRLQHYYQLQVILKPVPREPQEVYLNSLRSIDLNLIENDIRFIEDDWEHPCIGASGLGWEIWAQGMEITQFTYFQQCGGHELNEISCEITYGLERLAMCIQNVDNIYDIIWTTLPSGKKITYGDIHKQEEYEWSKYNFFYANTEMCHIHFQNHYNQALELLEHELVYPAYECALKCSHIFNILDARMEIKQIDRPIFVGKIRALTKKCAALYLKLIQKPIC